MLFFLKPDVLLFLICAHLKKKLIALIFAVFKKILKSGISTGIKKLINQTISIRNFFAYVGKLWNSKVNLALRHLVVSFNLITRK